jgi:hypothetical protein
MWADNRQGRRRHDRENNVFHEGALRLSMKAIYGLPDFGSSW